MLYQILSYQIGLSVEERFSPARLYKDISSVCLFDSVNLADLQEYHVNKHRHLQNKQHFSVQLSASPVTGKAYSKVSK